MTALVSMLAAVGALVGGWLLLAPTTSQAPATASASVEAACPTGKSPADLYACLHQSSVLATLTPEQAVNVLNALIPTRSDVGLLCHTLFHEYGEKAALTSTSRGLTDRVAYSCFGGYWHGFLSKRGELLDLKPLVDEVSGICSGLTAAPDIVQFDCSHGIGHALGMTPDATLPQAMDACKQTTTPDRLQACVTGVASAYSTRTLSNEGETAHGAPPGPEARYPQVVTTCNALEPTLSEACWERMTAYAKGAGQTQDQIVAMCQSAGDHAPACARSQGIFIGPMEDAGEAPGAVRTCHAFGPNLEQECLSGILRQTAPLERQTGKVTPLCDVVDASLRSWCQSTNEAYVARELPVAGTAS